MQVSLVLWEAGVCLSVDNKPVTEETAFVRSPFRRSHARLVIELGRRAMVILEDGKYEEAALVLSTSSEKGGEAM